MATPAAAPSTSTSIAPMRSRAALLTPALIALVLLATIGVMAYVQLAVKRIESELPLRVMDEKRDMERVARNFYEFLATTDAALARPVEGSTAGVMDSLVSVERDLELLRTRYNFDTLIGASALHAVLTPVVDDVRIWLSEGFGTMPPDSPLVLEVVATRARDALSKVYDKTTEAGRIAYEILERQSDELLDLRQRLMFVVVTLGLLAASLVWVAVRQRRATRAQEAAELGRLHAQARLHDALESASEGFAFFDSDERLVICNSRYKQLLLAGMDDAVRPGTSFRDVVSAIVRRGLVSEARADPEGWLTRRVAHFRDPQGPVLVELTDGRWLQVNERRTTDGGTVAVYSDLTELKRREQELMRAKEDAEAANEAKSAFLANVSHELRTPLTSILGFTRIVQKRLDEVVLPALSNPDARVQRAAERVSGSIEIVLVEGERLTALINNVLDLEKIEAGEMNWDIGPLDVKRLLEQTAAATRGLFESSGLAFRLDVAPGLPVVCGDHDRVVQVVVNLVANAVKFTPEGGVTVSARAEGAREVRVAVTDTGVGVAEEDLPLVFNKFKQVGDTLTEKPSGTGLGLAICREIIEHLGGHIRVESRPGQGSTFSFTLPAASAAAGGQPRAGETK